MENVDKDVAAMLNSLKKYDKLNESVLGMVTLGMGKKVKEEKDFFHNPNIPANKQLKTPPKEVNIEEESEELDEETVDDFEKRGGQVEKLPYKGGKKEKEEAGKSTASNHIGAAGGKGSKGTVTGHGAAVSTKDKSAPPVVGSGKKKVDEAMTADADVLDWMSRFSKLGNMKGYGR